MWDLALVEGKVITIKYFINKNVVQDDTATRGANQRNAPIIFHTKPKFGQNYIKELESKNPDGKRFLITFTVMQKNRNEDDTVIREWEFKFSEKAGQASTEAAEKERDEWYEELASRVYTGERRRLQER